MKDEKIEIAMLLPSLRFGGVERNTLRLANGMVKEGRSVALILVGGVEDFPEKLDPAVRLICLRKRLGNGRLGLAVPTLAKLIAKLQPRLLISAMTPLNIVALLAAWLAGRTRSVVVTERNMLTDKYLSAGGIRAHVLRLGVRALYPRAGHIVAVSSAVKQDLDTVLGGRASAKVLYNPVLEQCPSLKIDVVRPSQFVRRAGTKFLSVGRLEKVKGIDLLLKALARLDKSQPWSLTVVGDGAEREALKALANTLGIAGRVEFVGYQQSPERYFKKADVFVLPSLYEGLPTVLIEALGHGCRVVATDCPGGTREILSNGAYGVLVEPGNEKALAAALQEQLNQNGPAADSDPKDLQAHLMRFTRASVVHDYLRLLE